MERTTIAACVLILLAACEPAPPNECEAALTNGAAFGTPENRGPCWGRVRASSSAAGFRSYVIEMNRPGTSIASITYQGDEIVQLTTTAPR